MEEAAHGARALDSYLQGGAAASGGPELPFDGRAGGVYAARVAGYASDFQSVTLVRADQADASTFQTRPSAPLWWLRSLSVVYVRKWAEEAQRRAAGQGIAGDGGSGGRKDGRQAGVGQDGQAAFEWASQREVEPRGRWQAWAAWCGVAWCGVVG